MTCQDAHTNVLKCTTTSNDSGMEEVSCRRSGVSVNLQPDYRGKTYDELRSVDPERLEHFMSGWNEEPKCKIMDVGGGRQFADVAVKGNQAPQPPKSPPCHSETNLLIRRQRASTYTSMIQTVCVSYSVPAMTEVTPICWKITSSENQREAKSCY